MLSSSELRLRRKSRQRAKIRRVLQNRVRLCVHRTGHHIYAQIIDDAQSHTLAEASTLSKEAQALKNGGNKAAAAFVGALIAEKAKNLNISTVVFDRSGFLYHGRIKALADSAREHGLVF
ncbi:50S ribosomal protein L18 [Alphaproteobacteria bacterium]|nr:50S ribosomal protein L18 [Alphaproteobacteria bacterium]GHS95637.1 50S ribosomal protein L18 [Alphaproteobacteria bacterium]